MRVALVGLGAVGARVAEELLADPEVDSLVLVHRHPDRVVHITSRLRAGAAAGDRHGGPLEVRQGPPGALPNDVDVAVLTHPVAVADAAEVALRAGADVVTTADEPAEVRRLLALDTMARSEGRILVVGAAMAPGLSGVLARLGAGRMDVVDQIHVFSLGTGGPACARRHHAALSSLAQDRVGGTWHRRPGGSGRELVWFPGPGGGADCYRAGLADPVLLVAAFPDVSKVTARLAATRRDRMTSWLPMLRRPHPEGLVGAVRVELRGWRHGTSEVVVFGSAGPPAVITAAVACVAAAGVRQGRMLRPGAAGLAELVGDPGQFLREMDARGVRTSEFEGSDPADPVPADPVPADPEPADPVSASPVSASPVSASPI